MKADTEEAVRDGSADGVRPRELVRIFDTTLRDGEQSPGVTLSVAEKVVIAEQLSRLGVDIIEAGFPASSDGEMDAVQRISRGVGRARRQDADDNDVEPPVIAAMARANRRDIDQAWEGIREAERPRIHVVVPTSDLHLQYKLRKNRDEVLEMVVQGVRYARALCDDVEFSAEDATRTDAEYLVAVLGKAIEEGATTLNIPDTVGYALPDEYGALTRFLRERLDAPEDVIFSAHCHDDLGLATANALASVAGGCRQIEVSINGIGERAGNTCLAEVVMALHTRRAAHDVDTSIVRREIGPTSVLVSECTGMSVQPNKAIVGRNAFSHESGIHQDGMLKNRRTYEIMDPEEIGVGQSRIVFGKHSGRNALRSRLEQMGCSADKAMLDSIYDRFKRLTDEQERVSDSQLRLIFSEVSGGGFMEAAPEA